MSSGSRHGGDPVAAIAAGIALIMIGVYLGLIRQQGVHVAVWFVVALTTAALLSVYGVARTAPRRRLALAVSGVMMLGLGLVAIFSVGLPILLAGVVALLAAARSESARPRPAR